MCTNMCTYAAENRQNVKYLHVQCTLYTVEMCAEILKYFYAVNKLNNATCRDLKMWILSSKYVGGHRNMLCKSDEYLKGFYDVKDLPNNCSSVIISHIYI